MAGFFTRKAAEDKSETAMFRRVCTVRNSKLSPINIVVIKQVPVSKDKKDTGSNIDADKEKDKEKTLDITIREPARLAKEGDTTEFKPRCGAGFKRVSLGKNGGTIWEVRLPPKGEEKFVLEYEVRAPVGPAVEEV
jgi:hypothetical protein